jgi:F-type H+-transporting ATPase subunit b
MKRRFALAFALVCVASPALAAQPSDHGLASLLWPALNLALLIGALVFFARKPLRAYFASRRSEIQGRLQSASDQLAAAESEYAQWQRRLIGLDAELEEIRRHARERAEAESERILADARAAAERIRRDADAAVALELRRAREVLCDEATELAISLARERLERAVTDADRDRLLDEFIDVVGAAPGARARGGA